MLKELSQCPACGSNNYVHYLKCKDYSVSKETFNLDRCNECDLIFTNPRPKDEELGKYYQSEDYISHSDKSTNITNAIYKVARKFTLKSKISLINKYSSKGHLLDIGCGTGHFLTEAKNNGWFVTGIEPDENARKLSVENIQAPIFTNLKELHTEKFDVITMWHVLEHVADLTWYVGKLYELLATNGTLMIAVPNHESKDAEDYGADWAAYDVPRHLYHFNQSTMHHLMELHQFRIIEVLPMKLDSFYVSLLSESNTGTGIMKYPKALLEGLKANNYARANNKNYSSLIYIIKKK